MEQEEMVDIYMNHSESGQQREAVSCSTVSPTHTCTHSALLLLYMVATETE